MFSVPRSHAPTLRIMTGVFMLSLLAGPAVAQMVSIDPQVSTPEPGPFTVSLHVDPAGLEILGMEIEISFVASIVQLDSITPGQLVTDSGFSYFFFDHTGHVPEFLGHFDMAMLNGTITGAGEVAVFHFTAVTEGVSPVNFFQVDVRDPDNELLEFEHAQGTLIIVTETTGLPLADGFWMHQNYPNPFNPMTTISFHLPESVPVNLGVYTLDGRHVVTLVDAERSAGYHDVVWDGTDARGLAAASGTYIYRLQAGPYSETRKMNLMK